MNNYIIAGIDILFLIPNLILLIHNINSIYEEEKSMIPINIIGVFYCFTMALLNIFPI